jgi:hypothetical protein
MTKFNTHKTQLETTQQNLRGGEEVAFDKERDY